MNHTSSCQNRDVNWNPWGERSLKALSVLLGPELTISRPGHLQRRARKLLLVFSAKTSDRYHCHPTLCLFSRVRGGSASSELGSQHLSCLSKSSRPGLEVCFCNLSTWNAEPGGLWWARGQPALYSEFWAQPPIKPNGQTTKIKVWNA